MDQILRNVLRFDRFVLDLSRGSVCTGDRSVVLRPKAFELLRYLCEHAGQLVSKEALYLAVWPDVVVGDDSLSQCVHELRQILGDTDRRLIKTIPRRGYLLDARLLDSEPLDATTEFNGHPEPVGASRRDDAGGPIARASWATRQGVLMFSAAMLVLCGAGFIWRDALAELLPRQVAGMLGVAGENIMPERDAMRIADIAAEKQLPLPLYRIHAPGAGVGDDARKFVGVWVSSTGWVNSDRQFMMIVTNVDSGGGVTGYFANGPAKPYSHIPGPAFSGSFKGNVTNGVMRYDGHAGMHLASLTGDGRIQFKLVFQDGGTGVVMLDPAWTLPQTSAALQHTR